MHVGSSNQSGIRRDQNALLSALKDDDWDLLAPHLEAREFARHEAIFIQGDDVGSSVFPCGRMVVSLRVDDVQGVSCEVCTIGREGAVGGIISHGRAPAFTSAVVETNGGGFAVPTARLEKVKAASPSFDRLFARYADCLLAQIMQSAACNALHGVEQRIARWLLTFQDRFGGDVIPVTQEDLAAALGVGRPYASRQLKALKQQGLIDLRRG
ncbi:MAG TPA: Crp/Fnr family transcriptional regulator, partial [Beijerinckiaceae bacterium]